MWQVWSRLYFVVLVFLHSAFFPHCTVSGGPEWELRGGLRRKAAGLCTQFRVRLLSVLTETVAGSHG